MKDEVHIRNELYDHYTYLYSTKRNHIPRLLSSRGSTIDTRKKYEIE